MLVRRFQDMAVAYGYSLLRDWQAAEDASQEAFLEAFRDLPKLRQPEAFPGWFRRIVFKHVHAALADDLFGGQFRDGCSGHMRTIAKDSHTFGQFKYFFQSVTDEENSNSTLTQLFGDSKKLVNFMR